MLSFTACPDSSGKSRLTGKTFLQTLFFFLLVTQICFAQWYQQNSGTTMHLNAVSFIDDNRGFVVGDNGTILRTSNAGDTWIQLTSGISNNLNAISIISENNATVVGDNGTILHTTNGGDTWYPQISGTTMTLNGVYFIGPNIGMVVGGVGGNLVGGCTVLKTSTGGATWVPVFEDTILQLRAVWIMNPDTATVVGSYISYGTGNDAILRTTDEGKTWSLTSCDADMPLVSVCFIDQSQGFAAGRFWGISTQKYGRVIKTTDGGVTWSIVWSGEALESVYFVNSDNGWIASDFGRIYHTSNGGQDWEEQFFLLGQSLYGIVMTEALRGWCVGVFGLIFHTTNGGVSFVEEEQIDEVPTEFLLSQNFPNPFNPSTKIKYSVPQASIVVIKVYDVLGNEIETLVNEEKSVGTYELTWSAESLPSGVYFYQLRAGDFIQVKKMLLLK